MKLAKEEDMIRFIYGESGYGKTHEISNMIKKDADTGVRSYLIVPEQQAVSSERMMLEILPMSAQLELEILNFSRLYNRVCREYGGLEYNYITKPAKYLLMWQTLRELSPMLEYYKGGAEGDSETTEFMLSAVGEFKANSIEAASLEQASKKLDPSSSLYAKLRDLSLIYAAYNSAVSQSFSDSADDVAKLASILSKHNFFEGCNVYIDSFSSFTAAEHAVIERIFRQAKNTFVTIPLPEPSYESICSASISASERKLIKNAGKHGGHTSLILRENKRSAFESISYLAKNIWEVSETTPLEYTLDKADTSVCFELCATPYEEAEAAARHTLDLMRRGYRCRDIVVVMRDSESYRGIIEPAFERNGIPFFFSEKSDLSSKSAIKFILSALAIKNRNWRAGDVISHLKTGLYPISPDKIDMFESYVKIWNIRGKRFTDGYFTMNPDGYRGEISERGKKILTAANEVRELLCSSLIPLFARLDASDNVREMCVALFEYLEECNIENTLSTLAAKYASLENVKEAEEYSSIYGVTLNSLALCAELLADRDMTAEELSKALKLVFDMSELGTIPTSVDEVTIGSASTLRVNAPKCVLVLGLCEGEFPKSISDRGVLNSPERDILKEIGIEFSENSETRSSDELMFVKRALSLASEKLILFTNTASADGTARRPSLAYERAKKLLPHIKEHKFNEHDLEYLSCSAENASRYLFSQKNSESALALRRALSSLEGFSHFESASAPVISTGKCEVSSELVKKIFPKKMKLSQSRLEKYVRCNFNYYCSYVLSLREENSASFNSNDIGSFVHFILENLIKEIIDENGVKPDMTDDTIKKMTDSAVKRYIEYVCPSYERSTGSFTHLYLRLRNLSLLLVKNIAEEFSHSKFTPKFFEYKIDGDGSVAPPLEFVLENGDKISLSGVIDRVDIYKKDEKVYVRVVDYKTGTKDFSLEDLKLGLNTQMLIYLFSLCSETSRLGNREAPLPAGVVYLSSNIPYVELEDYKDSGEVLANAAKGFSRDGLLLDEREILEAMNDELSPDFLAGVRKNKKEQLSGKALTSADDFVKLRNEIEEIIISIAKEMKAGKADAEPLIHNKKSPCDWCKMKPVCRRTEKPFGKDF